LERVAVIGIGQTKHAAKRTDLSIAELVREAAIRALADAGLDWSDIDAVVIGKAPDTFEGVMMPELYLAGALGAVGKPMMRVHTAGSVGGSTAVVASHLISSGVHRRVLTVAFEKQSESNAMWALSPKFPFRPPSVAGAGGFFAPLIRAYIKRSDAPPEIGLMVSVKNRKNGLRNPYAHIHQQGLTLEAARKSPIMWDPLRLVDTCPSSDGAVALVLSNEAAAEGIERPAWLHGASVRSEPIAFPGRDQVDPAAGRACAKELYATAGITDPLKEIDVAELYVPFSWFEPMWLENLGFAERNQGWKMVADGTTAMDGALPIDPSGGVLCTNPIGASGMLRFAEAAMQVRGMAGEHQVPDAKMAMGHAYGGGSQFFAMWLVGAHKP
jgi:acetyl-CoA C-acetyltransferase